MFTKNYLKTDFCKSVIIPMGGSFANERVYLPIDKDLTSREITAIQWNEGGTGIQSPGILGGQSYVFLNSTTLPAFTLTLVDHSGTNICDSLVLSTLGNIAGRGKIRRFATRVQIDKCYITNIVTSIALVATAAINLTFWYK